MYLHQYLLFLMSALTNTPFLCNSIITFNTQKPLSRITMNPRWKIGKSNHISNPVDPRLSYWGQASLAGQSFPSTSSIPHMIPHKQQQTVWYSFPNGQGFHSTNMNPGHVNLFVHTLMLSSRQFVACSKSLFHI